MASSARRRRAASESAAASRIESRGAPPGARCARAGAAHNPMALRESITIAEVLDAMPRHATLLKGIAALHAVMGPVAGGEK